MTALLLLLLPAGVVYPPSANFDHAAHPQPCTLCHAAVTEQVRAADRARPSPALCAGCHRDPPVTPPRSPDAAPALKFNHRAHLGRGVDCAGCHPQGGQLPTEATCLGCHDDQTAPRRCATCHPAGPDGRLRTDWSRGALQPRTGPLAHTTDWVQSHGPAARAEPESCEACHRPRTCSTCHQGKLRPMEIHPADYILSHPADARRRAQTCESCHRPQTFCRGCHAQSGVVLNGAGLAFGTHTPGRTRFHPKGFAGVTPGDVGPNHHKYAARRDLVSCASCHAERDCVACHGAESPQSYRRSPHGPGVAERLCRRAYDVARAGCTKCHSDPIALERQCGR